MTPIAAGGRSGLETSTNSGKADVASPDFVRRAAMVWGGLEELLSSPDRRDEFVTIFHVDRATLDRWLADEGLHRCAALTSRGSRCRNLVTTKPEYDPQAWAKDEGGRCSRHRTERIQRQSR